MRILFLSRWLPYPADNGSKLRIFNLLRQLSATHDIDLVALDDSGAGSVAPAPLRALCASCQVVPYRAFRPNGPRAIAGAFSSKPRFLVDTNRTEVADCVARVVQAHAPDMVLASQLDMVPYALAMQGTPRVLEELEVSRYLDAVRRAQGPRRRIRAALTWWKLSQYLRRTLPKFALCTVVSGQEAANARRAVPGYERFAVVPNAVDLDTYAGDFGRVEPDTLVFTGALTYEPNLDAARYLADEIVPKVLEHVPGARLRISGRAPDDGLRHLSNRPGVELTGHVPDIRPLLARSAVSVVPIRSGGGTRLKILEAMALGTPVVATSKGAEGLEVHDGHDILLADDARSFADAVERVMRTPALRAGLADRGRELVASHYDWTVVGAQLRELIETVR